MSDWLGGVLQKLLGWFESIHDLMEKGKLIKVIFEYEGEIDVLNEDTQDWLDRINGMCIFMQNRGMNPFEKNPFKWIKYIKEGEKPM